ncbi:HBL175Wp [Eremothecium sinecaudum]|uniref:Protein STU1 n=1 Tax=Eremothecium sinecaudum TaxID=45286 RepID=A0A109UX21_9SACH|nr:HBL175Wp [Eremothecium sinecaudum]AMD18727.1 HBL175Wp [Eremothecium sinecaudum]
MEEPNTHNLKKLGDNEVSGIEKLQILMAFKTHVKKELVHSSAINEYFDVLRDFLMADGLEIKLHHLSHSSLCYLIKRVAMQEPDEFTDQRINSLIRVVLLRSGSQERKVWASSVKSLEAIYLCKPSEFETELAKICLESRSEDRTKCLLFMDELIQLQQVNNRNPMDLVNRFLDLWIKVLNDDNTTESGGRDAELIHDILKKYYSEESIQQIMCQITRQKSLDLFLRAGHSLPQSAESGSTSESSPFEPEEEIARLMDELPANSIRTSMGDTKDYLSFEHLMRDLEQLTGCFQALKETEHNWRQRQDAIILLRRIVKGNVSRQFPDEFVQICRELNLTDCISKAALSLRTTLSSHACNLIKEMSIELGPRLEPLVESLLIPLRSLLSATKKIASQTAFATAIILLSNTPYHNRLFQQCHALSRDKNISPRAYAAVFLRVYIIRFHRRLEHSSALVEEWLQKGLTDAQTQVREAMRITFWYWYAVNNISAKRILDNLPNQMRRIIETSIPSYLSIDYNVVASASSNESSRRSSLGPRKFPSYAAPTHSSTLQKLASNSFANGVGSRSLSDPSNKNCPISGTLTLSKKQLSAAKANSIPLKDAFSSHLDMENVNSEALDLSEDLTNSNPNTLVRKYLNTDTNTEENIEQASKGELENMYSYISSSVLHENQQGLQILENLLLMKAPIDTQTLLPSLVKLSIQSPKSFRSLTGKSSFYKLLPLINLVELCAINEKPSSIIIDNFPPEDIIYSITSSFEKFFPAHDDQLFLYYVKYRSVIFNYCFTVLIDIIENGFQFPADNKLFSTTCINVFKASGNDFNMDNYYTLISTLYNANNSQFIELLREAPTSSKFKIANKLQRHNPSFDLQTIMSREISGDSHQGSARQNDSPLAYENIDIDNTANLLEMTLVTDLKYSNIDTPIPRQIDNAPAALIEGSSKNDRRFHDNKSKYCDDERRSPVSNELKNLTEMTRVVSVYQQLNKESDVDMADEEKFRDSEDRNNCGFPLDDIFDEDKQVHSVKFNEIPRIIDINKNWDRHDGDTSDNTTNNGSETHGSFRGMTELVDKEMEKSPRLQFTDEDSKLLSDAINEIELRRQSDEEDHSSRPMTKEDDEESSAGQTHTKLSQEVDPFTDHSKSAQGNANSGNNKLFISSKVDIDVLSILSPSSLTYFELEHIHVLDMNGMNVTEIEKNFNTIDNGNTRITDISSIIGTISNDPTSELIHWLTKFRGLSRLWTLITDLVDSSESPHTHNFLVFYSALLIANFQLSTSLLSSDFIEDASSLMFSELSNLSSYENEFYICSCELREILIEHHNKEYLPELLQTCIKELRLSNERIKVAFILETIDNIITQMDTLLSLDILQSLTNFLQKYVSSNFTEWRYHSIKLLSQVNAILVEMNSPPELVRSTFSMLLVEEVDLVKSFRTT